MISPEEQNLIEKRKKKRQQFKKRFTKTTSLGLFKDKKTGFIINRNKNELLLTKAAMNNAKNTILNNEKVKKLECELEELKQLLIKVVERN
jgi:hypothetical protein